MAETLARRVRTYNVATGATPVQLTAATVATPTGFLVVALGANSAPVYLGGEDVTDANGYELPAGKELFLPADPAAVYVVSAAAQNVRVVVIGG
jgi:hypothetical protein